MRVCGCELCKQGMDLRVISVCGYYMGVQCEDASTVRVSV